MTVIVDSSFVYALYNAREQHHQAAVDYFRRSSDSFLVPDVALPEVCFLCRRDLGQRGVRTFLQYFSQLDAPLEPLIRADLPVIIAIMSAYADARFDVVDCCIMAIAARMNLTKIVTFDRRDFGIFQPRHCDYFELLP